MSSIPLLLVGSVPLHDAEAVFSSAALLLNGSLDRYPDGETGARSNWIAWQRAVFEAVPALTRMAERERVYQLFPPFTLRDEARPEDVCFGKLGFAREALDSYKVFRAKKAAGDIKPEARFQVALPTAWAPVYSFIAHHWQNAIHRQYETALLAELGEITAGIPADELCIQWDVATEMSWWEAVYPAPFEHAKRENTERDVIASVARLLDAVPETVELGVHLCYGSMNNKHWKEPVDTANLVAVANGLAAAVSRRIDYLHLPVPIQRDDASYFAPLANLNPRACTQLYLGLLHGEDGVEGALRRMHSARGFSRNFGIACECGLGRHASDAVNGLLSLHMEVAHAAGPDWRLKLRRQPLNSWQ